MTIKSDVPIVVVDENHLTVDAVFAAMHPVALDHQLLEVADRIAVHDPRRPRQPDAGHRLVDKRQRRGHGSRGSGAAQRFGQFPPPEGAPRTFREGFPFPPRNDDGAMVWDTESAVDAMYSRLPPETARALAGRLRPSLPPAGSFPLPGHPGVPTVLVYATDDEFFEPEWERFMARELLGIEPIEIPGGHFPMVEDPESLANLLDRLAAGSPT